MLYRKLKADYLFAGEQLLPGDMVLITTDEGVVQDVVPAAEAGDDTEVFSGILTPGFVNCHCHLELSHMKGVLPQRTGLVDFLTAVIKQRGNPVAGVAGSGSSAGSGSPAGSGTGADREKAMAAAEQEMLDGGIVAVGDICNTADTLLLKTEGRLFYHNFIETMGFIEQTAGQRFAQSLGVFTAFAEGYALPIEANSIVPHAPYSVSPALFRLVTAFPGNHILTIHNQESEEENEFYVTGKGDLLRLYQQLGLDVSFFKGTGRRSLESYLPAFYRNQHLILVHNVATREEDVLAAKMWAAGGGAADPAGGPAGSGGDPAGGPEGPADGPTLFYCLCPNANEYISGRLPDVEMLVRNECRIVLGTDSLASNHQLSILEEMKTLQRAFPRRSIAELLRWATYNGAKALQLDGVLGSFEKGKQPGVVLLDHPDDLQHATARRLL